MKKMLAVILLLVYSGYSIACSTFLLSRNGRHVFGRNYDWVSGNGMVLVNAHGVAKTSFMTGEGKALSWVSRYGSVTFNQFGKEFPHGGMNERGLVVELMWLSETAYPSPDDRAGMHVLQWIQYLLDNCASVAEVISTDKNIRISSTAGAPLHFLVADASGKAASIEFIDGKMVVHQGSALKYPVLTNTVYSEAIEKVSKVGSKASFSNNSVERFATACKMVDHFRNQGSTQNPIDYSFSILRKISQGNYTKWSIVYDITNRQIWFTTNGSQQRRQLALRDFNFSCDNTPLALNLNDARSGPVSKHFTPLTFDQNKKLIERSARESAREIEIQPAYWAKAADYFRQVSCRHGVIQ